MDYCFPGDEFDRLTVLVVIERYTKMKKAVVVPSKGSTGSYAARIVIELINERGDKDKDVILKSDQEAAIKFLVDDVCACESDRGSYHQVVCTTGQQGVERHCRAGGAVVEQCLRTLTSSLDERMAVKIDVLHPVLTWLCEFVGYMMNRMEVASDGKTPYERVKGKRSEVMGLEFCEKVLWKYHPGKRMAKFDARWSYGLFLGVRSRSAELIAVDRESRR